MARDRAHIPGFGNWDVSKEAVITEYFEVARASKGSREDNGVGHVDSASKRDTGFRERTGKVDNVIEQKSKQVQRHGAGRKAEMPIRYQRSDHKTGRQAEASPGNPPTNMGHAGSIRESADGRASCHKSPFSGPSSPKKQVYQIIPVSNRPMMSTPSPPKDCKVHRQRQDIHQKRPEIKHEIYRKRPGNRSDMGSSPRSRKEVGQTRTPSASPVRPSNGKASSNKTYKNKSVPKFGDWDLNDPTAGSGFTTLFDNARNEKKGTAPVSSSSQHETAIAIDEDLYKQPNFSHKKHGEKLLSLLSKIFSGKRICQ